jgi:M6 family metalloprotease-like protein
MTITLSGAISTDVIYAQEPQTQEDAEVTMQETEVLDDAALPEETELLEETDSILTEGCVLDEETTIYDTWRENNYGIELFSEENAPSEVQTVHEIVVFIAFADEGEEIYETRGGYDYIMSQFEGGDPSLDSYLKEYSRGQVDPETHVWPQKADGSPLCYVDEYPVSYYLKQSTSNPNGYPTSEKSSRRRALLNKVIDFMGEDFLTQLGLEGELYNLVFVVPDSGSWNDLLWSHKSSITINGKSNVYNLITYNTNKKNVSRTVTHEFMHSLGYPDMYRYYTDTSANPLYVWSIMGSTTASTGHPTVHEKNKYGSWLGEGEAIKTITKSGHYELGPSVADPDENTLAYKIPVEGEENQYFMIEYRGNENAGYDAALSHEGLIFYRVMSNKKGNSYGPPDEVYVLRGDKTAAMAYFDGTEGRTEFSEFYLYDDTTELGISVYNIKMEDGYMSFDIEVPYVELQASKKSPISVEDSTNIVFSTDAPESSNHSYRFGVILDGKEVELSSGYQSGNSIEVNLLSKLGSNLLGNHTFFVDVKNTSTGAIKRGTLANYEIQGVNVSKITSDLASPQQPGSTITLSATVEREQSSSDNAYSFEVVKNGNATKLVMTDNYTAAWTPEDTGIYTIRYSVTDGYGITATKEIDYPIASDNTAYILYKNSSWNQAYIHYQTDSANDKWTTAPGVKMSDSNVSGYSWAYLIDLKSTSSSIEAVFNNGNGTWDNNSEKNYTIKAGLNCIGGTNLKLSSLTVKANTIAKKQSEFTVTIKGGIAPYACDYTVSKEDGTVLEEKKGISLDTTTYSITSGAEEYGTYTLSVTVKDSFGQSKTATTSFELQPFTIDGIKTSVETPQLTGTEITLTESRKNAYVEGDGLTAEWTIKNHTNRTEVTEKVTGTTFKWKPMEIGNYEITVTTTDDANETASYTIYYDIVDEIVNQAIVYYGNSSFSKAYIHYQIDNGTWTTVPGVAMEKSDEQSGYTWKYVIDMGEEIGATVCFNNGGDSWDSRDQLNYEVGVGTYGIKNSAVTKLTPAITATPIPTTTNTPTPSVVVSPSVEPTETPTEIPTAIPTVVVSVTEIPTLTPGAEISVTAAPTMTVVPTITIVPTNTVSPTITPTVEPTVTAKPTATPTVIPTVTPTEAVTPTPAITKEVTVIPTSVATVQPTQTPKVTESLKKGMVISDTKSKATYKVTATGNVKTVVYVAPTLKVADVKIPDTVIIDGISYRVTEISDRAFMNNKKLTTITIGKNVTSIGTSAFQGCTSLKKVKKGANVKKIGDKAFYGYKKLTSMNMGSKITTIGKNAFYKCTALKKITIPGNVKKIGTKAFYGCKNLKTITIKSKKLTSKNVGSKSFKGIHSKATIKVPKSKVNSYKKMLKSKGVGSKAKIKKS